MYLTHPDRPRGVTHAAGTVSPIDPCLDQLARWTTTVADDAHLPALLTALEALPDPRDRAVAATDCHR